MKNFEHKVVSQNPKWVCWRMEKGWNTSPHLTDMVLHERNSLSGAVTRAHNSIQRNNE